MEVSVQLRVPVDLPPKKKETSVSIKQEAQSKWTFLHFSALAPAITKVCSSLEKKLCPSHFSLHVYSSLFTQSGKKYTSFHYDVKQVIEEAWQNTNIFR